jgi:hypothetical protein
VMEEGKKEEISKFALDDLYRLRQTSTPTCQSERRRTSS